MLISSLDAMPVSLCRAGVADSLQDSNRAVFMTTIVVLIIVLTLITLTAT